MQRALTIAISIIIVFILGGCMNADSVFFVTKTSLGIDFDTKPSNASIVYDRTEGYIGPRYENGAMPPVLAFVSNNGELFNPKIQQLYATGDAAYSIAKKDSSSQNDKTPPSLIGKKKLAFFGTTTTTGLKVDFAQPLPNSFIFGYRRKEFSFIPLGRVENEDFYPSVLASINNTANASSQKETSLRFKQFFATGNAAVALAKDDEIRKIFKNETKAAFAAYYKAVEEQNREALMVLRCFLSVSEEKLLAIWEDAVRLALIQFPQRFNVSLKQYKKEEVVEKKQEAKKKLQGLYVDSIGISIGESIGRAKLLAIHRKFVCPSQPQKDEQSLKKGG